jgi:hypothetical protein
MKCECNKRLLSVVAAAFVVGFAAISSYGATIDPTNYDYSMTISPAAGRIAATLSNFPLLVRLSSTRQPWFDPADCGTGGADLRFALVHDHRHRAIERLDHCRQAEDQYADAQQPRRQRRRKIGCQSCLGRGIFR